MKQFAFLILISILPLWITGCEVTTDSNGDLSAINGPTILDEQMRAADLVKLISPDISNGTDESTFNQAQFGIGPQRHLLLSYSGLGNNIGAIDTAHGGRVIMEISLESINDSTTALNTIKLCPITSQWMLAANWFFSGPSEHWITPGGDVDNADCVIATNIKPEPTNTNTDPTASPAPAPTPDPDGRLYFDVTRWYLDYVKGRGVNFGLALTSSANLTVRGDQSGDNSPRIYWYERDN